MKEDTLAGLMREKKQAEMNIQAEKRRIEGIRERANQVIAEMKSDFDSAFESTTTRTRASSGPRAPHGSAVFLAAYLLKSLNYPVVIKRSSISETLGITDKKYLEKIVMAFFKSPLIKPMSPGVKGSDFVIHEGVTVDQIEEIVKNYEAENMSAEELLTRHYGAPSKVRQVVEPESQMVANY